MAGLDIWFGISNTCGEELPKGEDKIGKPIKNMMRIVLKRVSV